MDKASKALDIRNLSISYPGHSVLENISLSVDAGETYGLIGLNGQGKTTLIKTILKLRDQDGGEVKIFDIPHKQKNSRKQVAYLPERFEPPWFLNGIEFIKFSLKMYHETFSEQEVLQAADDLALDRSALKRRVQTYSKGMRQKLGLMATFLTKRDLLILDEPMSGLDPQARALVKKMISNINQGAQSRRTVFFSSHVLSDMDELCGKICVLHNKSIPFEGFPSAMKSMTKTNNLEQSFLQLIEKSEAA